MKQKVYLLENLGCANCAAKMEDKMNALPEVESASITFATKQLRVTAEDPDALLEKLTEIVQSVESQVTIVPRAGHDHYHEHHECGCGHHHHEHHECSCGHEHHECHCDHEHHECHCGHDHHEHHHDHGGESSWPLVTGAALFVAGLLLGGVKILGISLSWPIFVAAYILLGWEVVATAARNLVKGHIFDENFLMSIATLGAFLINEAPEAVGVMLFYRLGEYFEHRALERSRSQIMEAVDLRPEVVQKWEGETLVTIPAGDVRVGDLLLVRPGDRIPLDGVVVEGSSRIDTAPITGEPVPVAVGPDSQVISGCVNTSGQLTVKVEKGLSESMVTRILESVENAAAGKPKIHRFITRFARIYTPVVVTCALLVAVIPSIFTGDWGKWVYTALSFLVMSCPCALVLSVPLAFFSGIGIGSKRGILFKSGASMEALASVKAVVMDKTGTLTKGDFSLQEVVGGEEILALCAACEAHSTHPIGQSVVAAARERGLMPPKAENVEEFAGHGIRARVGTDEILCGNEKLMKKFGVSLPNPEETPHTRVYLARNGNLLGYLLIGDTLKSDAPRAVSRLKKQGLATAILTGDGEGTAQAVGKAVGADEVYALLLPEEKLSALRKLRGKYGPVMFVGDGINDAPVLAGADVGAAMGSGADAAIEAADVVFMTAKAAAIPEALELAAQTKRIAWQNVAFALGIKLLVMILGIFGYASMWAAVFADSGVAMLCVLYAILPLYSKKYRQIER